MALEDRSNPQVVASVSSPLEGLGQKRMPLCNQGDMPTDPLLHGLYVRSKKLMSFTEITSQVEWKDVNWAKAEWTVFKLQKRIYRASQRGDVKLVRRLQKMVVNSRYAKLIAVRKVTQENKGKNTAGVDGVKSLNKKQRMSLVNKLEIDGKACPTRRVWIPKPGRKEKRPLGIPTIRDRAQQALLKLVLEPEWEAKFESESFGFRPGRSCHDAIEAIRIVITAKPKYVLDADIAKCFDQINHQKLLAKIDTIPKFRRQIKAWLKGGVFEEGSCLETNSGTPQGGVISPLLANIALHGMQNAITEVYPAYSNGCIKGARRKFGRDDVSQPKLIRYADDFVLICDELSVVEECRELIKEWLKDIGLELKPEKTQLVHTLRKHEGREPGFDFLGFTIRQFAVGINHSGNTSRGKALGYKTIIKPSDKSIQEHYLAIAGQVQELKTANQSKLIKALNPKVRGWCNYQSPWNAGKAYSKLEYLVFRVLWRWAKRRHPNKSNGWIARRYWKSRGGDNWSFSQEDDTLVKLHKYGSYKAGTRWTRVKGNRSPFDGDVIYWSSRMGDNFLTTEPQKARLLKRQKGKCHHCGQHFRPGDLIEKHHQKPQSQGGKNSDDNLVLLHLHCHDQVHG